MNEPNSNSTSATSSTTTTSNNSNKTNVTDKRKLTDQQLNNSLTSMEWLFPLSAINKLPSAGSNSNAKLKIPGHMLPMPMEGNSSQNNNQQHQLKQQPDLQEVQPQQPKSQFTYKHAVNHSVAQRAEPHRPIDLNAEYKCADPVKREGKPPYSYVNLCTFAINSSPKKKMTLNEIYQWISDNFSFYKITANGWKVS